MEYIKASARQDAASEIVQNLELIFGSASNAYECSKPLMSSISSDEDSSVTSPNSEVINEQEAVKAATAVLEDFNAQYFDEMRADKTDDKMDDDRAKIDEAEKEDVEESTDEIFGVRSVSLDSSGSSITNTV